VRLPQSSRLPTARARYEPLHVPMICEGARAGGQRVSEALAGWHCVGARHEEAAVPHSHAAAAKRTSTRSEDQTPTQE